MIAVTHDAAAETTYLNHAGTSWPKPNVVLDAVARATQTDPSQWPTLFRQSLDTVANFFHVPPSRLVLTPSCTAALNLALMDLDWRAGDRVITSRFEHHALYRNLLKLRQQEISVLEIPPATDSPFDLEILDSELQLGQTRLVAITAACNVTGAILPIDEIIKLGHQYGAKVLVDGAQVAGWMDLDLPKLGVDFFTFAGHKGLQAPWGIGGLYVHENATMHCPSATCEIGTRPDRPFEAKPGYCDAGSVDLVALSGLAAGCQWLSESKQDHRLPIARQHVTELAESIRDVPKAEILHDIEITHKMPTLAVSFGNLNQVISQELKQNRIIASSGFQCAPVAHESLSTDVHGVIRFSYGPGQSQVDLDRVISALHTQVRNC